MLSCWEEREKCMKHFKNKTKPVRACQVNAWMESMAKMQNLLSENFPFLRKQTPPQAFHVLIIRREKQETGNSTDGWFWILWRDAGFC